MFSVYQNHNFARIAVRGWNLKNAILTSSKKAEFNKLLCYIRDIFIDECTDGQPWINVSNKVDCAFYYDTFFGRCSFIMFIH